MRHAFRLLGMTLALAVPSHAMAAAPKCVTRAELKTGIAYLMPSLVDSVVAKCTTALPAESYIASSGAALVDRFKAQAAGTEDDARALIERFVSQTELSGADGKATIALVESLIKVGVQSAIKPEMCSDISEALAIVDPLPAQNTNALFEFILVKVNDSNAKKAALAVDQVPAAKKGRKSTPMGDKPFICPAPTELGSGEG